MGVAETWYDNERSFSKHQQLPESERGDRYKVFFSGGENSLPPSLVFETSVQRSMSYEVHARQSY